MNFFFPVKSTDFYKVNVRIFFIVISESKRRKKEERIAT